ncbi:MAG: hypothetical protein LUC93_03135 [Planctomycetaceae bacterium]|nr:hypothetical protein [Planctomycetaceae bacterium]
MFPAAMAEQLATQTLLIYAQAMHEMAAAYFLFAMIGFMGLVAVVAGVSIVRRLWRRR